MNIQHRKTSCINCDKIYSYKRAWIESRSFVFFWQTHRKRRKKEKTYVIRRGTRGIFFLSFSILQPFLFLLFFFFFFLFLFFFSYSLRCWRQREHIPSIYVDV